MNEEELNGIVKEYLSYGGYSETLEIYEAECLSKGKVPISQAKASKEMKESVKKIHMLQAMIAAFDEGDQVDFNKMWELHLPEAVRKRDSTCQRLEFYVYIYFAIFPLLPQRFKSRKKVTIESSMQMFKKFLENKGAALSKTTEFLQYYALPFVPSVKTHPTFKALFADGWVPDLKVRLERFLQGALNTSSLPRLYHFANDQGKKQSHTNKSHPGKVQVNDRDKIYIDQLLQQLVEAEERELGYISRHNRLQAEYHSLVGIATELVTSLEDTIRGRTISTEKLADLCNRLMEISRRAGLGQSLPEPPVLFEADVEASLPYVGARVPNESTGAAAEVPLSQKENHEKPPLDYAKVKDDLMNLTDRNKCILLQALRWRLTRAEGSQETKAATKELIEHDVFGCADEGGDYAGFVRDVLSNSEVSEPKEYFVRLINALCSFSAGRAYVLSGEKLLNSLQSLMVSESTDNMTRQNALGALQKLSLRRAAQSKMINSGLVKWLIDILSDLDSLSDYSTEYAAALLMNLSLRTAGKAKCAEYPSEILGVLNDLLEHENVQVRSYVNGTLYSALTKPKIKEQARAMGMDEILKQLIKVSDESISRQLEYIIEQLEAEPAKKQGQEGEDGDEVKTEEEKEDDNADKEDIASEDGIEDDDEDGDEEAAPEVEIETLETSESDITGERLLLSHYTKGKSKPKVKHSIDIEDEPKEEAQEGQQEALHGNSGEEEHHEDEDEVSELPSENKGGGDGDNIKLARVESNTIIKESYDLDHSLVEAEKRPPPPSENSLKENPKGEEKIEEYYSAFATRPKIPRTPGTDDKRDL
eukprot:Nk52_evm1s236 gene=Nk52_evmTU1s236